MNVLEFVLVSWLVSIATAWCFEYAPEIYREQKAAWQKRHQITAEDVEATVEIPKPTFDPEKTMKMKLPKVKKQEKFELPMTFVVMKLPAVITRRRHAKA
jgi:hypothetical protein